MRVKGEDELTGDCAARASGAMLPKAADRAATCRPYSPHRRWKAVSCFTMANPEISVSVVIPHYGAPTPTLALIRSLLTQSQLEIIVVDDCSPSPLPRIDGAVVINRSVNGGFGSTVNTGIAAAQGTHVLVLNSDLEVPSNFVANFIAATSSLQPAVVSPNVTSPGGRPQWVGRHFPLLRHQVTEWLTPLARFRSNAAWHESVGHDTRCVPGSVVRVDWVVGAAMLLPVQEFRSIGGFDEGFYMNSEEVDLQRRFSALGVPSYYVGTLTVLHEGGGSSESTRRRRWLVESRLRYARKWKGSTLPTRAALTGATLFNYSFNVQRRVAGKKVNPNRTLREELGYLWTSPETRQRPDWRSSLVTPE